MSFSSNSSQNEAVYPPIGTCNRGYSINKNRSNDVNGRQPSSKAKRQQKHTRWTVVHALLLRVPCRIVLTTRGQNVAHLALKGLFVALVQLWNECILHSVAQPTIDNTEDGTQMRGIPAPSYNQKSSPLCVTHS